MPWFPARTSPLWLLIAPRWSYERPRVEAMKGVKATEQENYVENKRSYSCFKTFSQLGLGVFNQLSFFFFFYCRFSFLPNTCRGKEKIKKREKNTFSCQSVACKAMKSTLREMSTCHKKKEKGLCASYMPKNLPRPFPAGTSPMKLAFLPIRLCILTEICDFYALPCSTGQEIQVWDLSPSCRGTHGGV